MTATQQAGMALQEAVLTQAGDASGPGLSAAEIADGGIAFGPDHAGGLLPELPRNRAEAVLQIFMPLDMPPAGGLAVITPKAFQPFAIEWQHAVEGSQKFVRFALAEPAQHQLTNLGDIEVIFRRNTEQALFGMTGTEELSTLGALSGAFLRDGVFGYRLGPLIGVLIDQFNHH